MNDRVKLHRITALLARFGEQVKIENANEEFSINKHGENFLIKILNTVYGCDLENVGYVEKKNYPAIDLRSKNETKIAFQITSTADFAKVRETLIRYIKEEMYKDFETLYIFIITEKKSQYDQKKIDAIVNGKMVFNKNHILDKGDLYTELNKQRDTRKNKRVLELLEEQFTDPIKETKKKPIKAIKREKDILIIKEILATIHIPTMDIFIEDLPYRINNDIDYFWEIFNYTLKQSSYFLYDQQIDKLIRQVHEYWERIILLSARRSRTHDGDLTGKTILIGKVGYLEEDENEKLYDLIVVERSKLHIAFKELIKCIQTNYIEIDLDETSKNALLSYRNSK